MEISRKSLPEKWEKNELESRFHIKIMILHLFILVGGERWKS